MSSECLSSSFDKDQLKTILTVTITASIVSSVIEGTKIVLRISLPTSKSNANNKLLAKLSLIVSRLKVCTEAGFLTVLRYEINAITMATPMIMPAIISIPIVR